MKSKFSPRILVAAVLLALGVGGTAFAMNPERCGAGGGRMEQRMAYGMKEMSRLHDELKLDARQEAIWQEADKAGKASMNEMRDQRRKQHEEVLAAVSQPGDDMRAKVGIGAGARWRSPVGPLQMDLAYGLATREWRLHLNVGFTF